MEFTAGLLKNNGITTLNDLTAARFVGSMPVTLRGVFYNRGQLISQPQKNQKYFPDANTFPQYFSATPLYNLEYTLTTSGIQHD